MRVIHDTSVSCLLSPSPHSPASCSCGPPVWGSGVLRSRDLPGSHHREASLGSAGALALAFPFQREEPERSESRVQGLGENGTRPHGGC